jgi:hypothetical protein
MLRVYEFEYVEARRVLLDALEALGAQRRAVVLVGAQAIYHRVARCRWRPLPATAIWRCIPRSWKTSRCSPRPS